MNKQLTSLLKDSLLEEFKIQDRKGVYAFLQKKLAYNSNRIEGSTLTSEETASLFDTGTVYTAGEALYRAKDVEEMNGHFLMFNHMLKTLDKPLTQDLIKEFHYQLKSGVFEDRLNRYPIGEYKNKRNIVSDITTVLPEDVPIQMEALLQDYRQLGSLQSIVEFHAKYEKIHPFQDGNGRIGRIIMFKQCLENNQIPIIVKDEEKAKYYHFLHDAQEKGNYAGLLKYCKDLQTELTEQIKPFLSVDKMNLFEC